MPSITQLEYIIAVDKHKHFGRAARECHVAQPSLSTQIQKLEEELNIIIFDRSMKPILTTDIGLDIIEQAKVVVREHKKILYLANQSSGDIKGEFELAVIPTLAPYLIPYFVATFAKKYPNIKLKINEYKTEDIIERLARDEIDAGLLVTPLNDLRIIERHLFYEPFFAYVAKDHPLAKKNKGLTESDLDANNLWILEEGHCFRDQVLRVCSLDRDISVLPNVEFTSGNLETLKNLVKKGAGYTLLPELAVIELSKQDYDTYIREFKKPIPTREVSIVHSRSFYKETVINALESCILENLPSKVRSLKRKDIDVIEVS